MRGIKRVAVLIMFLLVSLTWYWLSRPRTAFDVAPGYHVLNTEFVTGTENAFHYTLPTLGRDFTAYYQTMSPTNVMWILYERPSQTSHILRWHYTNTAGAPISVQPSARWFDKSQIHVGSATVIQAVPVPVPNRKTILNQVVCFEDPDTGTPLFKVKIP